jgi:DMSO/TMAO reductase YedYZ molybdopterin-dependent catalytic subunit/thiosulfate reductase cytochrome b subunit
MEPRRGAMSTPAHKHPLAVRWLHWINFPLLLVMLWSGLLIYWANAVYGLRWGGEMIVPFFPDSWFAALGVPYRLAEGMALHFVFMWLFAVNGVIYVGYTCLSGEWRYLVPNRDSFAEAVAVILHDLHLRRVELPRRKFNGAQQIAYTLVILMGAGSLVTGLAIYKPVQLAWLTSMLGGYEWARWEHFWLAIGYVVFFVVHITQVAKAGWKNFRAMVTGDEVTPVELRGRSRRSFLTLAIGAAAAAAGWKWLTTRPEIGGLPSPVRRGLEFNESLALRAFSEARLAPMFPREMAREPRVNGGEGMSDGFDPDSWRLRVQGQAEGQGAATFLTLADIQRLPRVEMTTELKCIEGWSTIVHWAGARLRDFAAVYPPATRSGSPPDVRHRPHDLVRYVSIVTPDEGYYVGLDMPSALHPQTLLCYEMNGQPLSLDHGGPLRLVTTVKYGIKSIKRIGSITYTDERPRDFWAERGYDWYAGH